jgi:tRNA G18 (ribose-2'-O)-methylase SpoU
MKPCLVFGSESKGIPQEIVNDSRAEVVAIPQVGVIRSYNVSAAAAIAMWELVRSTL